MNSTLVRDDTEKSIGIFYFAPEVSHLRPYQCVVFAATGKHQENTFDRVERRFLAASPEEARRKIYDIHQAHSAYVARVDSILDA